MEPADRVQRLFAAVADACPLLLLLAIRSHAHAVGSVGQAEAALGLFLLLGAAQIWLLTASGQTLGKRVMDIRIVRTKGMRNGGFTTNVLLRASASACIGLIPYFGPAWTAADLLFILRDDRRCLHDLIAGTCVVKGSAQRDTTKVQ